MLWFGSITGVPVIPTVPFCFDPERLSNVPLPTSETGIAVSELFRFKRRTHTVVICVYGIERVGLRRHVNHIPRAGSWRRAACASRTSPSHSIHIERLGVDD